jgi:antitoxin component YwqK of YwqJK toxin-antitoxin module
VTPDLTRDGIHTWFHKNGKRAMEALFEHGEIVGERREWDEEGNEL